MTEEEARGRFTAARVARLATADDRGLPHLVPLVFAVSGATVYSAVDQKPKRHQALRRLANLAVNPRAALLVDHYEDDWGELWWVRADGVARLLAVDTPEGAAALHLLAARYPQYRTSPPPGPVLAIDVERWSGWAARSVSR